MSRRLKWAFLGAGLLVLTVAGFNRNTTLILFGIADTLLALFWQNEERKA